MCVIGVWVYWCSQYWCVGVLVCTAKQWNPSNGHQQGRKKCPFREVSSIQGHPYRAFMKNIILAYGVISNPCRDKNTHSLSLPLLPLSPGIFWDWSGECQEDHQVPGGCLNFELSLPSIVCIEQTSFHCYSYHY